MGLIVGLLFVIAILFVIVVVLAHYHLLSVKIDNEIANLETTLGLTGILTKLNMLDTPTSTTTTTAPTDTLKR